MTKPVEHRTAMQIEKPRRHKYNAKKTEIDGHVFDSQAEANRYNELKLMARAGLIANLELQPVFELLEGFTRDGKKIQGIKYVADFAYIENGRIVVEDVKGHRTKDYLLKRKLFLYRFPEIDFWEITNGEGKWA